MSDDVPWRRLHPASLVVNLVPMAWRTLRGFWPLLLVVLVSGGDATQGVQLADLGFVGVFFGLALANSVVHWATLRYRVVADKLEIRSGLLNRQNRALDAARIQNIEIVQNLFQRAAGLVEVRIETAGDVGTEGLLSAVSRQEADALRAALDRARGRAPADDHAAEATTAPIATQSAVELVAYGLTQRRVGAAAVLIAVGMEVFGVLDPQQAARAATGLSLPLLAAGFLVAFALSLVGSALASVLRYGGYALRQAQDGLVIESGLTTRRRAEIPLRKVQVVRVDEPAVRRAMGYGTLHIETAALGAPEARDVSEGMVPMAPQDALRSLIAIASPQIDVDPWTAPMRPAAARALWRAMGQRVVRNAILAALIAAFTWPTGAIAFVAVPVAIPTGWLAWRAQRWEVSRTAIVARRGVVTRRTWLLGRDKLQSVHLVQGPFLRLARLGRVVVRVAGTAVSLPLLDIGEAQAVFAELQHRDLSRSR